MSARIRDSKGRQHKDLDDPDEPATRPQEDQIEIVEVLGVDESTGVPSEPPPSPKRPAGHHSHPPGAPHTDRRAAAARVLEEALRDKDKYYDLLLRKQAEFENYRKRAERDRVEFRQQAAADLILDLLPALDNLDRALGTGRNDSDPLHQGVVLIRQQILEVLRRVGLSPLDTQGAIFDPRLHEAVDTLEAAGFEKGRILEEVRRGYMLNERLLRPAMVKVAAGGPDETSDAAIKDGSAKGGAR